jgi:hypothetical protein
VTVNGRVAVGVGKPVPGDVAVNSGVVARAVGVLVASLAKVGGVAVGVNDGAGDSSGAEGVLRLG